MKCPNCGWDLEAGLLYCEHCGEEIQIVPDFEPEIENSIIETLSTVAEEIGLNQPEGEVESAIFSSQPVSVSGKTRHTKEKRRFEEGQEKNGLLISIGSFIGVVLLAVVIGFQMYRTYSVPYQISRAEAYAEAEDYKRAMEYMLKADELSPEHADIQYVLSGYIYLNQEPDKAVAMLVSMTQSDRYTVEEKKRSYERAIAILDEQGKYQEICDLLETCEDPTLVTQYQYYMALEPEFSVGSGSYDEMISLKMSSNTSGRIYYTLNGSKPTTGSKVYMAPVLLEAGDYVVSAMFVNDYGIESEIVRYSYHIDLLIPDPPKVGLFTGTYTEPTSITVSASEGEEIYYTVNGNRPTIDSIRYTGPIPMPLGRTRFQFIAVSSEGVSSEVVSREFELRLVTDVTVTIAIQRIKDALVERQVLRNSDGKAFLQPGYFEFRFDTLIDIPDKGLYYKFDEYYGEGEAVKEKTGNLYVVSVYEGLPNRLIYNEAGEMDLISLHSE